MDINHIYKLCCDLQSITSTKAKKEFLIANRCDDFDFFLKWLLDPMIVSGIDKKKLDKKINDRVRLAILDLKDLLIWLKNHNTGRDIDVLICQDFINCSPEHSDEIKEFIKKIITKSLKLGVDVKLVNHVYGKEFIHVHEVQLGSPRNKLRLKDGEWFSLSQKLNGVRCTYIQGKMVSRQGKEIVGLSDIAVKLDSINFTYGMDMVYDGEIIRRNVDNLSDNDNFRLTISLVNADYNRKPELDFVLFDALPYDEFMRGYSTKTYSFRRKWLDDVIDNFGNHRIRTAPIFYQGTDQSEIDKQLGIADYLGYEGLMLNKDSIYECKRTNNLIKIKSFKSSDLKIVGVLEGSGKLSGTLGSIVVDYKGNTVNVGSGFTDEQRNEYWAIKDELIGRIAEIKYKEISKNKDTGLESLQFPVIVCIREDKTEPSYE